MTELVQLIGMFEGATGPDGKPINEENHTLEVSLADIRRWHRRIAELEAQLQEELDNLSREIANRTAAEHECSRLRLQVSTLRATPTIYLDATKEHWR